MREFSDLLAELKGLDETSLTGKQGEHIIGKMFDLGKQCMGSIGCALVLGLFVCAVGKGSAVREIWETITVEQGKAVIRYVIKHPELYKHSTRSREYEGEKI